MSIIMRLATMKSSATVSHNIKKMPPFVGGINYIFLYYLQICVVLCYNDVILGTRVIFMRVKTCCFTGHRDIPFLKLHSIKKRLEKAVEQSIQDGYCYFGAGGALGFDTLAANTILQLKSKYPSIKLILVLPCRSQM